MGLSSGLSPYVIAASLSLFCPDLWKTNIRNKKTTATKVLVFVFTFLHLTIDKKLGIGGADTKLNE